MSIVGTGKDRDLGYLLDQLSVHRPRIEAFFRTRGYSQDQATDLTQDTLCRASGQIGTLRDRSALLDWLIRIAANIWKNDLRRRGAAKRDSQIIVLDQTRLSEAIEPAAQRTQRARTPEDELLAAERIAIMKSGIDSLEDKDRRCLLMYTYQGLSYEKIADLLTLPTDDVRYHIQRARSSLKRYVSKRLGKGGS